jgi:3',5'-cyclic AMP phosphodiesterase CpdA
MRIAIITDIHEDFEMLEKAFAKIRSLGYDLLVCLGDVTGFAHQFYDHPPDANACLDLLRANAHLALAGNHDLFTAHRLPSYHIHNGIPGNWYELSFQEQFSPGGE